TWRTLGVSGRARRGPLQAARIDSDGVVAAYAVNELPDEARAALLPRLLEAGTRGSSILIVEPIARRAAPWWGDWCRAFRAAGGSERDWRFPGRLPPLVAQLDRAAGLN